MTSLIDYGEQGFWVSNGTNALLYEILVAMTQDDYSEIHQRLDTDEQLMLARFGGGFGFSLDDFERIFGGTQTFEAIVRAKWDTIDKLCPSEQVGQHMRRVFNWSLRLMHGEKCNFELPPYAAWRTKWHMPVYALTLGWVELAPLRRTHPSIHELEVEDGA